MPGQRRDDEALAARAVAALKRLQDEVVAYSSLAGFEDQRKVARVPFETFRQNLREVSRDVARTSAWLPEGRLRVEIRNALLCYQDGAFSWARIYQPRVVQVSELVASGTRTQAHSAFLQRFPTPCSSIGGKRPSTSNEPMHYFSPWRICARHASAPLTTLTSEISDPTRRDE